MLLCALGGGEGGRYKRGVHWRKWKILVVTPLAESGSLPLAELLLLRSWWHFLLGMQGLSLPGEVSSRAE